MPDTVPAVELRGVRKHYGIGKDRRVAGASDVSLVIEAGTFVTLSGASGPGKSTLLHLIGAMERPDSGTIVSGGTDITALRGGSLAPYRRTVGFVFQRYNLLPALTALDNVIAPVLPYRTSWNKRDRAANSWPRSAWPAASSRCRQECPAVSSSAWPSPGRSSTARLSSWPTSQREIWTPRTPPRCSGSSRTCARNTR